MTAEPAKRLVETGEGTAKPVAVIDIGTTAIRMAIAEIGEGGLVRTLETLSQAASCVRRALIQAS